MEYLNYLATCNELAMNGCRIVSLNIIAYRCTHVLHGGFAKKLFEIIHILTHKLPKILAGWLKSVKKIPLQKPSLKVKLVLTILEMRGSPRKA